MCDFFSFFFFPNSPSFTLHLSRPHFSFSVCLCACTYMTSIWWIKSNALILSQTRPLPHVRIEMQETPSLCISFRLDGNKATTGLFLLAPHLPPKPTSHHPSPCGSDLSIKKFRAAVYATQHKEAAPLSEAYSWDSIIELQPCALVRRLCILKSSKSCIGFCLRKLLVIWNSSPPAWFTSFICLKKKRAFLISLFSKCAMKKEKKIGDSLTSPVFSSFSVFHCYWKMTFSCILDKCTRLETKDLLMWWLIDPSPSDHIASTHMAFGLSWMWEVVGSVYYSDSRATFTYFGIPKGRHQILQFSFPWIIIFHNAHIGNTKLQPK